MGSEKPSLVGTLDDDGIREKNKGKNLNSLIDVINLREQPKAPPPAPTKAAFIPAKISLPSIPMTSKPAQALTFQKAPAREFEVLNSPEAVVDRLGKVLAEFM
jgi:hypothetical protein